MFSKVQPKEGNIIAEFELTGAKCPSFLTERNQIKVMGSVEGRPSGATDIFTAGDVTAQGTLHMFSVIGPKAGLEGSITISGTDPGNPGTGTWPLRATTVAPGTTGYTCVKGEGTLHGEHCLTEGSAPAEYGHVGYSGTTEATGTNEQAENETKESSVMRWSTVVGTIPVTIDATGVFAEGTTTNSEEAGGMIAEGEAPAGIHFTGVTVTTQECTVEGPNAGTITTKPVKATTKGQGDFVKFEPTEVGGPFAEFNLVGPGCPAVLTERNPIKVFGSVKAKTNGATLVFNHSEITTQGTLHLFSKAGPKSGLEGKTAIKARADSGQAYAPIAATT